MQMVLSTANSSHTRQLSVHAPGPHAHFLTPARDADVDTTAREASARGEQGKYSVRLNWREGKGPRLFHRGTTERMTSKSPICLRSPHDPAHHQKQHGVTSSLTHHWKGLCTNTLEGNSLSQKEQMSFVPNGNGF